MKDLININEYHKNAMGMIFDSILNKEESHDCELEANGEGACNAPEHKEHD